MTSEFAIAVHALVYLDRTRETIASEALAENVCTNPVCIRRVMGKLKKAGIIETKEGLGGGYHIASDAETLNLRDVCAALKVEAVKFSWHSENLEKKCMIACGMAGIMDDIVRDMNQACESYLQAITIRDIEKKIFTDDERRM